MRGNNKLATAPALRATPPWKGGDLRLNAVALSLFKSVFMLLLLCMPLLATTVVKMDLAALVKTSDSIVQGVVTNVETKWDAGRRMAFTETTIDISDRLKGDRSQEVTIRHEGGKIGSMTIDVSGTPKFRVGDDVIVFLKSMPDGTFYVVGLDQGKYAVSGDAAVSNTSSLEVIDPATGRILTGATTKTSVNSLKAQIRELVK